MDSGTPNSAKGNAVLHVRQDSDSDLEQLFKAVMQPKDGGPSTRSLPMRMRKLPPSFFKPPPMSGAGGFSSTNPNAGQRKESSEMDYAISHARSFSSPASLGLMAAQQQQQQQQQSPQRVTQGHQRTQSYDALENDSLPPGWEARSTPTGQKYYVNHFERTTTWIDPRLKSQSLATLNANQALGALPEGWEQAVTSEGEVYYINHETQTTTWFDPRRNRNPSGSSGYQQSQKTPHSQQMNLRYLQLEKEKLRQRQQMIFHQELMLQQQITSPAEGSLSSNSMINSLVREKYGTSSPGSFSPVGAMTPNHQRVGSADSGLDGMGSFHLSPTSSDVALNNMEDVEMEQGSAPIRQSKESTSRPTHEANLNQLNQVNPGHLPEFFDRMQATNVDLGIMESESDLGQGLDGLHSEVLSDVDIMLSPNPSKSDGFLTWL